jgi:hypothetical protein
MAGMSASQIVLRYVCPSAGSLIALFMFGCGAAGRRRAGRAPPPRPAPRAWLRMQRTPADAAPPAAPPRRSAPLPAIREVKRRRFLGEVNALPFAAM